MQPQLKQYAVVRSNSEEDTEKREKLMINYKGKRNT